MSMELVIKHAAPTRFEFELEQGLGFTRLLVNGTTAIEFLEKIFGDTAAADKPIVYVCPDAINVFSKIKNKSNLAVVKG